jgi:hypothetical protein
MPTHIRAGCAIAVVSFLVFVSRVSAQEQAPSADDFLAQTAQEATLEWLWGEATQVDLANGTVTVQYLDYDTDTEKTMAVTLDDKTRFENAASVADIAVGDTLSIDYTSVGGTIRARNISVEKAVPEETSTQGAIQEEMMPQEAPAENIEVPIEPRLETNAAVQDPASTPPDVSSVPTE